MINIVMISVARRLQWKKTVLAVAILLIVALSNTLWSALVRGYTFPTGNGSGCTSSWCTGPGNVNAGWKVFALSGGGPGGNNGRGFVSDSSITWADVQARCGSYAGITKAYVFVTQRIGASSPYLGLNYESGMPGVPGYQDASPGQAYVYYADAVRFDPGTASGSWGSSVGAFCYYDNPPWAVTVTASANKTTAEPGEKITWTHRINNDGPNTTNRVITWRSQDRGWSNAAGANWTLASGTARNGGDTKSSTDYTVTLSDVGKQVCRTTIATPANNLGGTVESALACVTIGKKPKVQIHGGDLIVGRSFSDGAAPTGTVVVETSQTVKNR